MAAVQPIPSPSPSPSPTGSSHSHSYSGSSAFHSPTKQTQPNAHPYAIKTTSTALLSRSTSSSAQHASSVHRYVPVSPSSPSDANGQGIDKSRHRPSRHRYSRSLTSDMPLPLPPPPVAASSTSYQHSPSPSPSPSPTRPRASRNRASSLSSSEPEDNNDTPRRPVLLPPPVSFYPSSSHFMTLPPAQDPNSWTPEQLAAYLQTNLLSLASMVTPNGRREDPTAAATEIAAFVRREGISGRAFSELTEGDGNVYVSPSFLPPFLPSTVQTYTDPLHQTHHHPRAQPAIPPHPAQRLACAPPAHPARTHFPVLRSSRLVQVQVRRRPRTRSRNLSDASNSSLSSNASADRGRVRDMVDELERTRSHLEARRAGSPVKRALSSSASGFGMSRQLGQGGSPAKPSHAHAHGSAGGRGLPVRPSVSDLFGGGEGGEGKNEEDGESTITGAMRRNANNANGHGREPRLLPFPPSTPTVTSGPTPAYTLHHAHMHTHALTPAHTGTQYALPSSPSSDLHHHHHQQQQQQPPLALGDYELGFRHAHASPSPSQYPLASAHSQTFIVRHNPSPSNTHATGQSQSQGQGSAGKQQPRLLPYPPVVAETALYHPRPRRVVGVGALGVDSDSGEVVGGVGVGAEETSDEEVQEDVYESAVQVLSASRSSSDGVPGHGSSSVSVSSSGPGPGEREDAEPSIEELLQRQEQNAHPISGVEAWEMELGETVKRIRIGGGGHSTAAGHAGGAPLSSKARSGTMAEIGRKAGRNTGKTDKDGTRRGGISGLFDAVEDVGVEGGVGGVGQEDGSAPISMSAPAEAEAEAEAAEVEIEQRTAELDHREEALAQRETSIAQREASITQREDALGSRETAVHVLESDLGALRTRVSLREDWTEKREAAVQTRETILGERERAVDVREEELRGREKTMEVRDEGVAKREVEVEVERCRVLEAGVKDQEREEALDARLKALEVREKEVEERERELNARMVKEEEKPNQQQRPRPSTPVEILHRCWAALVLPIVGEARMPGLLKQPSVVVDSGSGSAVSASTSTSTPNLKRKPKPYLAPTWAIRRDMFLGRFTGGFTDGYLVLMGIGVCVVVLRLSALCSCTKSRY
ncbi:hypothetical protein BDZ97DRAFT_1856370 [Flammula alnicola]|nr:hypothetical protein BDZ97DRAFT_1856370 [Flammula alnicola]